MKKFLKFSLLFLILILLLPILYFQWSDCGIAPWSCGDYSMEEKLITQKIAVGAGPEDIAIDTSIGYPRIIVSCTERRKNQTKIGGFYGINPTDNSTFPFKIIPTDFKIHPHGIDIVTIDSIPYLYAISHDKEGEIWQHSVIRFEIKKDSLIADVQNIMKNELMNVPNDLDVLEDGSFYASNYVPNMDPMESTKAIIGIKNGSVVHYDGKGNWEIVIENMCYPNGIWVDQKTDYLWVANGGCQEVVRYKIKNGRVATNDKISTKSQGIDIPIGDNLMIDEKGTIWTAAHPCPLKFLDHANDSADKSPMQVFSINPTTMKVDKVLQDNGNLISAASTVLPLGNRLYISQVFDPFILVVEH